MANALANIRSGAVGFIDWLGHVGVPSKYSRQQSFSALTVGCILISKIGEEGFFFHPDAVGQDKKRRYYNNQQTEQRAKDYPESSTLQEQTAVGRMADNAVRTGVHDFVVVVYRYVYRKETAQVHDGPPAQYRADSKQTRSKPMPGDRAEQSRTHVAKRGKMSGDD